jgi:hypothetical protein
LNSIWKVPSVWALWDAEAEQDDLAFAFGEEHKISVWMRLQVMLGNGGVGERLKPAVLKN